MSSEPEDLSKIVEEANQALRNDDANEIRKLLARYPALKARINEPVGPFGTPAIVNARSKDMLDVLLEAGADPNARSCWWAGSFGLLDSASPELAAYAIERGAVLDVHAAARLAMMDKLEELLTAHPELVHARGGDGQTPLHFAGTVKVAALLLDRGARIDERDIDHESTPAQYMVKDRQEICRFLIERGCATDLLMACAVGDLELARTHLDANPECIRLRVNEEFFPMKNPHAGGTIYQWTLGFHVSAHQVARKFHHEEILRLLLERSPVALQVLESCWLRDEAALRALQAKHPDFASGFSESDRRQVVLAARNNETDVVRLLLEIGLPVDSRGQHGATPLHWAAFHGNAEMVRSILAFAPSLEVTDADFKSTPLGWATHGSEHGWYCRQGDYVAAVDALLKAGAKPPDVIKGTQSVKNLLAARKA